MSTELKSRAKKVKNPVTFRNNWVKSKLRFNSLKWPPRNEALKLARVERGKYKCAMCEGLFKSEQVDLDHTVPVVALDNEGLNWNEFIARLFPEVEGFQVLCKVCHEAKTRTEDDMRNYYNQERKDKK